LGEGKLGGAVDGDKEVKRAVPAAYVRMATCVIEYGSVPVVNAPGVVPLK
jgi:hypothetical protein